MLSGLQARGTQIHADLSDIVTEFRRFHGEFNERCQGEAPGTCSDVDEAAKAVAAIISAHERDPKTSLAAHGDRYLKSLR